MCGLIWRLIKTIITIRQVTVMFHLQLDGNCRLINIAEADIIAYIPISNIVRVEVVTLLLGCDDAFNYGCRYGASYCMSYV